MSHIDQYEYCAQLTAEYTSAGGVVLDYGCGAGRIVAKLLAKNVDAYGCDVYYGGGDHARPLEALKLDSRIKKMEGGRIPFDDSSFDTVINNQVMEHVDDLDAVIAEIHRVLKPGGRVISFFPDKSVWREGHTGIPFLHWLQPGKFRLNYAVVCLALGLGYRNRKPVIEMAEHHISYLDRWTRYRSYDEIRAIYDRYLGDWEHIEADWLSWRLGRNHIAVRMLPDFVKEILTRKLAGMAFIVKKTAS
jgi:SAM-dependent methyltransferase